VAKSCKIAASVLAADFTRLGEQIQEAEAGGADLFHLDIMDGHFVPNISFGPMIVQAVRGLTNLFLDVHLMIEKPERYLEAFALAGAGMLNVHVETCPDLRSTIRLIKGLNLQAGIAINPETPFDKIKGLLKEVDRVLVMSVHPGFGGQHFMADVLPKVIEIAEAAEIDNPNVQIALDGGVDSETTRLIVQAGGNVLVAGTSVFRAPGGIAAGVRSLREAAGLP